MDDKLNETAVFLEQKIQQLKKIGRPKEYDEEMQKKNLRLPKYIWEWLDKLSTNRTKALVQLYNERKK